MASVGSLSSSTSNSIRGYGGLASGLDRDELIKGMTLGSPRNQRQDDQFPWKIYGNPDFSYQPVQLPALGSE